MTKTITSNEPIFRWKGISSDALEPSRVIVSGPGGGAERIAPLFIPTDQAYYWSSKWQRDEAETLANLKAGDYKTFDDPSDAIKYLLADD